MAEQAPELQAADELQAAVTNQEDQVALDAMRAQIEEERSATLQPLPELGQHPDGSVDTVKNILNQRAAGQEMSSVYGRNRRG